MATLSVAIYMQDVMPHWALHTRDDFHDQVYQVLGSSRRFRYEGKEGVIPEHSIRLSKLVRVGTIKAEYFDAAKTTIADQAVNNDEAGWNCQYWVREAIDTLIKKELIEVDQEGIDYIDARVGKFTDELPGDRAEEEDENEENEDEEIEESEDEEMEE